MCVATVIRQGPSTKVIISARPDLRLIQTCDVARCQLDGTMPLRWDRGVGMVPKTHSWCWPKWKYDFSRYCSKSVIKTERDSGGALLVNGTLVLKRTRGVATLPRVVETAAPRDAPTTRDTWESLRDTCLIHDSRSNCSRVQFR